MSLASKKIVSGMVVLSVAICVTNGWLSHYDIYIDYLSFLLI